MLWGEGIIRANADGMESTVVNKVPKKKKLMRYSHIYGETERGNKQKEWLPEIVRFG